MYIPFIQTFSNARSFTCIKDSSSIPGLSSGGSFYCQGTWRRPSENEPKQRWASAAGSSSGCTSNSPKLSYSTPHVQIFPFLQRQHSSPLHFTDSENKRQKPRRTLQETACGEGWKTPSFSAWLHLNQEGTSSLVCPESLAIPNASAEQYFFVEVFKYRENKQILK